MSIAFQMCNADEFLEFHWYIIKQEEKLKIFFIFFYKLLEELNNKKGKLYCSTFFWLFFNTFTFLHVWQFWFLKSWRGLEITEHSIFETWICRQMVKFDTMDVFVKESLCITELIAIL